jgi:hypothetical protein
MTGILIVQIPEWVFEGEDFPAADRLDKGYPAWYSRAASGHAPIDGGA